MAWNTIRRATAEDIAAVEAAAERFCERHGITRYDFQGSAVEAIDSHLNNLMHDSWSKPEGRRIERLWERCVQRATGEPAAEGLAHGYVGYHSE